MILIITNRYDSHADFMIQKFYDKKKKFFRFNTDDFPTLNEATLSIGEKKSSLSLKIYDEEIDINKIKSIWYRRPIKFRISEKITNKQAKEFAQEECRSFIEGLWLNLKCKWVSPIFSIRKANYKLYQLKIAKEIGFDVPRTMVTNNPKQFLNFWYMCKGEVIYKPLGINILRNEKKQILLAYTNKLGENFLERAEEIRLAPCLFQEYIPKKVELRITVVDKKVFACEIHSQKSEKTKIDWRHYDIENTPHLKCFLPIEIEKKCIELVKTLNLRFGAIDIIITPDGKYKFLEINPNGQWLWIEQLTGLPISEALFKLLIK